MEPQARTYFLNAVLVFVPDLVVGWAAARLTDSGWYGFFITLIALQAIYFFSWFKKALWDMAPVLDLPQAADGRLSRELLHR